MFSYDRVIKSTLVLGPLSNLTPEEQESWWQATCDLYRELVEKYGEPEVVSVRIPIEPETFTIPKEPKD